MTGRTKVRKLTLDELSRKYGQPAIEDAFTAAEENKARDTMAYVTKILEKGEPESLKTTGDGPATGRNGARPTGGRPARRDNSHALCDSCGQPHWINEMFVINGRAYRDGCVPAGEDGREEPYWFEVYRDGVRQQAEGESEPVTEAEVMAYPTESLVWWLGKPSCDDIARPLILEELEARGEEAPVQKEGSSRELTPSAESVEAWWGA